MTKDEQALDGVWASFYSVNFCFKMDETTNQPELTRLLAPICDGGNFNAIEAVSYYSAESDYLLLVWSDADFAADRRIPHSSKAASRTPNGPYLDAAGTIWLMLRLLTKWVTNCWVVTCGFRVLVKTACPVLAITHLVITPRCTMLIAEHIYCFTHTRFSRRGALRQSEAHAWRVHENVRINKTMAG